MTTKQACTRCGGSGEIPQYKNYAKGVCFLCKGSGKITVELATGVNNDPHEEPDELGWPGPCWRDLYEQLEAEDNERD